MSASSRFSFVSGQLTTHLTMLKPRVALRRQHVDRRKIRTAVVSMTWARACSSTSLKAFHRGDDREGGGEGTLPKKPLRARVRARFVLRDRPLRPSHPKDNAPPRCTSAGVACCPC